MTSYRLSLVVEISWYKCHCSILLPHSPHLRSRELAPVPSTVLSSVSCQGDSQRTRYWSQWIPRNWHVQQKQSCHYVSKLLPILKLHGLAGSQTTLNLNKGVGLNLEKARFPKTWTCFLVMLKTVFNFIKFWLQQFYLLLLILRQEAGSNSFFFVSCQVLWNITPFVAPLLSQH